MPFQSTVRIDQTTGIVGDIIIDGPMIGVPAILNSTSAANNVIGRAFRHIDSSDLEVSADAATGVFAGILANSKVYATSGTAAGGTLAPTLVLPNNSEVELGTCYGGNCCSSLYHRQHWRQCFLCNGHRHSGRQFRNHTGQSRFD